MARTSGGLIKNLNKSSILNSQIDLLNSLKHLNNFSILKQQEADLKILMHKLFSQIASHLNHLEKKIPHPRVPKQVARLKEEVILEDVGEQYTGIDLELKEIQDKLKELNS